jgi:UDP-N-acetylmuramoyl-tripeptide--D-alanyl-D-alanine ligase
MSRTFTKPIKRKPALLILIGAAAAISAILLLQYYLVIDLSLIWPHSEPLTHRILDRSLELGTQFMLHNQRPAGNFNYQYDWIQKKQVPGDSQVRQAGAMWGLALIYQDQPDPQVGIAVEKAIAFFEDCSATSGGARYVAYPGSSNGATGAVAFCALTHIDYLRAAGVALTEEKLQHYRRHLDEYLRFLISARTEDNLWHRYYDVSDGQPFGGHSPYSDGESLLALIKSAKYMGRSDLKQVILDAAEAGYLHNVRNALRGDPDSAITKGYYQWSSMAFFELATSGWPDTGKYGDYVLELADWMIDVHKTLRRTLNTGYAYEGIIHAYELAVQRQDAERVKKYARVINIGMGKLTSWQVGSPLANRFIRRHPTDDPLAIGGVQNHRREALLRIDVTQHQMHAVILARRYVYKQ